MATTYVVTTTHDLALARAYVAYRNAVLWPTRRLQRAIIAACVAAVGFMFQVAVLRYALWASAVLVVAWTLVGDRLASVSRLRRDPARRGSGVERYLFSSKGYRLDPADEAPSAGAGPWQDYGQVVAIYTSPDYWILPLRSGTVLMLARHGVGRGGPGAGATDAAGVEERFETFLARRTGLDPMPLDSSVSAKVQRAQEGRKGYLEAHPSWISRTFARKANRDQADR